MPLDGTGVTDAYFAELPTYLETWERDAIESFPARFVDGSVDVTDVLQIYLWKNHGLNVSEYNLFRLLDADLDTIQDTIDEALSAPTVTERIEVLTTLEFLSVPAASAILAFSAPETYAVYETSVVRALRDRWPERAAGLPTGSPTPADYERFQTVVGDLADELDVPLRTLDRALWLHGREDVDYSLPEDVGEV